MVIVDRYKIDKLLIVIFTVAWILLFTYGISIAKPIQKGWNCIDNGEVLAMVYTVAEDYPIAFIIYDKENICWRWAVNISCDINEMYMGCTTSIFIAKHKVEKVLKDFSWI
jgi:hypothetical protein